MNPKHPMTRRHIRITTCTLSLLASLPVQAIHVSDFTIFAMQNVTVGGSSQVTGLVGSGVHTQIAGGGKIFGNLKSGNTVTMNNSTTVSGNITNPGTFTTGSGVTYGSRTIAVPTLPTLPPITAFTSGGTSQTVGNGATITLAPGSHGAIQLGGNATLNLSAGVYMLDSLTAGNGLDLNINLLGGKIKILVKGQINLATTDMFLISGGTSDDVYTESHATGLNAFKATAGSDWVGDIFTPYGDIHYGGSAGPTSFKGHMWAGRHVDLEHGVIVTAPEPTTWIGVGLASLALLRRKRG